MCMTLHVKVLVCRTCDALISEIWSRGEKTTTHKKFRSFKLTDNSFITCSVILVSSLCKERVKMFLNVLQKRRPP
jgi:hypothetical protein